LISAFFAEKVTGMIYGQVETPLKTRLVKLLADLKGSIIGAFGVMVVAVTAAGVLNYAFNIVMTRFLGKAGAFGEFYALSAIFLIVSIGAGSFQTVIAKYVAGFSTKGEQDKITVLTRYFSRWFLYASACVIALSVLIAYPLARMLKLESPLYVVILGSSVAVSVYITLPYGILQGMERFVFLGGATVATAVLRLVFGIILVLLGAGVYGALGAATAAGLVVILVLIASSREYFFGKTSSEEEFHPIAAVKYLLPVASAMFLILFLTQVDAVLVKALFSRKEADIYSYAALAGKAVFFFPDGISLVMFPRVSALKARGEPTKRVLYLSLAAVVLIVCAVTIFYQFFPVLSARFFAGSRGVSIARIRGFLGLRLVVLFGLVMSIYAILKLIALYLLAHERTRFVFFLLAGGLIQVLGIIFFARRLPDVLLVMLCVGLVLLVYNLLLALRVPITKGET